MKTNKLIENYLNELFGKNKVLSNKDILNIIQKTLKKYNIEVKNINLSDSFEKKYKMNEDFFNEFFRYIIELSGINFRNKELTIKDISKVEYNKVKTVSDMIKLIRKYL